jgi:2-polyprenyl-3-methyl-5-hydroxy-6-metoxy-1,4-benzoquinol methylase
MVKDPRKRIRKQDGIVIGNVVDKSRLKNPVLRYLVHRFDQTLLALIQQAQPKSLHEVGCGEGRLTRVIAENFDVSFRATDFSRDIIKRHQSRPFKNVSFVHRSIYDLTEDEDHADVIICCEVLEHLDRPGEALDVLRNLTGRNYIFSVPREPIWRILNMMRGAYVTNFGNTPGHLQHWSPGQFVDLLKVHGFQIEQKRFPLPWVMVRAKLVE